MSLRDQLADLLGAEIQAHPITIGGKSKTLHFLQFSDEVGKQIFRPIPEEAALERGVRIINELVAASVCDEAGQLISTPEEVAGLKAAVRQALFEKAALTNNIVLSTDGLSDPLEPGAEAPKA